MLRVLMPEFFTIGEYRPEERTGPAIWLKCIVDRTVPEAPPPGITPLLYLPNVSRQILRAAVDCPAQWASLIELQYRGRVWHQSNGRDWTVTAFLVSGEGLALDVAQDRRTEEALGRALPLLADIDVSPLAGRRLDADDFDRLSVADPVRDLLQWLNAPERFEQTQADRTASSVRSPSATRRWTRFGSGSASLRRHIPALRNFSGRRTLSRSTHRGTRPSTSRMRRS
jgi:hypothetical protein